MLIWYVREYDETADASSIREHRELARLDSSNARRILVDSDERDDDLGPGKGCHASPGSWAGTPSRSRSCGMIVAHVQFGILAETRNTHHHVIPMSEIQSAFEFSASQQTAKVILRPWE